MHLAPNSSRKAYHTAQSLLLASVLLVSGCSSIATDAVVDPTNNTNHFESVDSFEMMAAADWQKVLSPLFDRARIAVEKEYSQFPNNRFADHFLSSVMAGQSGTYAALYSTNSQQVLVSDSLLRSYISSVGDDAVLIKHALNALLIHELVHAADDHKFGIHRNRNLNFRASFAQSAVYEGHAQYVTRRICQIQECLPGLKALDGFMFGDETAPNQITQSVQAVSRNVLEYSYVEGERFIASLARRENGAELIKKALDSPPIDPIQILDPSSFPNRTRTELNEQLLQASSAISHPWISGNWVRVETSPLKGVNLRSDPARRTAAIDGFTRLIRGMVALQHYDQSDLNSTPIEVTLMNAESAQTAEMFGQSLSSNLIYNSGGAASESVVWLEPETPVSVISVDTILEDGREHIAMVVSHKNYVLQLVGVDIAKQDALNYAESVLLNLSRSASTES